MNDRTDREMSGIHHRVAPLATTAPVVEGQDLVRKLDQIKELQTVPVVLLKIHRIVNEDGASIDKLAQVIASDQAIAAKVLRLVNSSFYGHPSKINSIPRAIMMLGFNVIRNAAISVSVMDSVKLDAVKPMFNILDFWRHSLTVAILSRYLAGDGNLAREDEAYTAGLLHDIGKLIMYKHFHDLFMEVVHVSSRDRIPYAAAERDMLPFTHAQVGAYIVRKWQFPPSLADAILYHDDLHHPVNDPGLLISIYAANKMANREFTETAVAEGLQADHADYSGILQPLIRKMISTPDDVQSEIEAACSFLFER